MALRGIGKIRRAVLLPGILLVFLTVAITLLHTPPVKRLVSSKLRSWLLSEGIDSSFILDYNLLTLSASLRDVELRSRGASDLPSILKLSHADIEAMGLPLLRGNIHLRVRAGGAALHLVIDPNGRTNVPVLRESGSKSSSEFLLQLAELTGSSIRVEDRPHGLDVSLPKLRTDVRGDASTLSHHIHLETSGTVAYQGREIPITRLTGDAIEKKESIQIRSLSLVSDDSRIQIVGRVEPLTDAQLSLAADLSLNLARFLPLVATEPAMTGTLASKLEITGPARTPSVRGTINGANLAAMGAEGNLASTFTYEGAANRLRATALQITSTLGTAAGSADVALREGQSSAQLRLDSANLAQWSRLLKLPVTVASVGQVGVKAEWPALDFLRAKGTASLLVKAAQQSPGRNIIPIDGSLSAALNNGNLAVNVGSLSALGVQSTGTLSLRQWKEIGGELTTTAESLAFTTTQAAAATLLKQAPDLDGSLSLRSALSGTLKQPAAALSLEASALRSGQYDGGTARAEATFGNQRLDVASAVLEWAGQTANLHGGVDLKPKQPTLELDAEIRNGSIPLLLKGLRQDLPVSGTWSAAVTASGALNSPAVQLRATAANLAAYGERLGLLSVESTLQGRTIELKSLSLTQPRSGTGSGSGTGPGTRTGTLEATGTYGIDSRLYTLQMKGDQLTFESFVLPSKTALRGVVDLTASGSGSVDDPGLNSTIGIKGLQVDQYELGDASATIAVAARQARLEAALPRYHARLTSTSAIEAPHTTKFELGVQGLEIASLPVKLEPALTGSVDAVVRGAGEPGNWKDGNLEASITRAEVTVRGQTLRNDGPLQATVTGRRLTVAPSTVTMGDSRLSMDGTLPLDDTAGTGAVRFDGEVNVRTVQAMAALEGDYQIGGRARLQGTVGGTAQKLIPDVDLIWQDGRIVSAQWKTLEIAELRASIRDGAIRIPRATASWQGSKLTATAEVPFALLPNAIPLSPRTPQSATLKASLTDLDLRAIPGMPQTLGGAVAIEAVAEASTLDLNALKARIKTPTLRLQTERYTLEQQGESAITIENGIARVEQVALKGPETQVSLYGTAELKSGGTLNLRADSDLDIAVLSPFVANTRMQGLSRLRLVAFGTLEQPKLAGFFELKDGRVSLSTPSLAAERLSLRGEFTGDRFEIRTLRGDLNGGRVRGGGYLRYTKGKLGEVRLNLTGSNIYLNYPFGLKTVSGGEITLLDRGNNLVLGGKLEVVEGSYTEPITLEAGLLQYFQSRPSAIDSGDDEDSILSRLLFNVGLQTRNPLVVDNNLARAELTANLRLVGSYRSPGLTGRIEIDEGGRLYVAERNYLIERGVITFTNERRIEPFLDISASTRVAQHDITMLIQGGGADRMATTLTSDPQLPEEDIASLLITGRKLEDARGAGSNVAKEQALSLLAGSIGGTLSSQVRRATGISQFRVEPGLIAPESNPTARLTVGQDLAKGLSLIYSMNLTDSRDQIYVAQWEVFRRFVTRGVRQSDASFRFEFNHDIRLGGTPAPKSNQERMQRLVRNVRLTGTPVLTEQEILAKLKAKPGKKYDFFALRSGMDRIEKQYAKRGLLESTLRLTRAVEPGFVDLNLNIKAGPAVNFVYEGWTPPGSVRDQVKKLWQRGVFDAQRTDDAIGVIRGRLVEDGYLQAEVKPTITTPSAEEKQVLFDIQPGVRYGDPQLQFVATPAAKAVAQDTASSEASAIAQATPSQSSSGPAAPSTEPSIPAKELERIIEKQKLHTAIITDPARVTTALTAHYRAHGYFDAVVSTPRLQYDAEARKATAVIQIEEGAPAKVGSLVFQGNRVFEEKSLLAALPLVVSSDFTPSAREQSVERLRNLYGSKGYNDADIQTTLRREDSSGRLRIEYRIDEGKQSTVAEVLVAGNNRVSERLIRSQLPLKPGDPVVMDLLSRARRDLYGTSAFSLVEIDREEIENAGETKPVRLTIRVREMPPWDLRYGAYVDTERGPGGIADISNRNSLGSARVIGFRGRYDADLREGRVYFSQPLLRRFPLRTVATTFFRREIQPSFRTDRVGFSVQEESRFRDFYLVSFGYRLERAETRDRMPDPIFGELDPIITRITPLTATIARDTRDDILDATRGSLISHAFEYAPEFLGSQLRYAKYFGQYFKFVPLAKPADVLFQSGLMRPRLIYAGGVRLGLATGLGGQILIPSERFFAGGATTLRGFAQNTVGPADVLGPLGGDAVFVVNNELRFPIYGIVEGVGFSDIGNVYRRASDFALSDLRKSAGFGLRIRTPYFLLRFDYGFKLDRRPGESSGRLFFSIGQAF